MVEYFRNLKMKKEKSELLIPFNFVAKGKALQDFSITLVRGTADDFRLTLARWLQKQQDDISGNTKEPAVADGKVTLRCTEETMMRIERQFATDILRTDPPAKHIRGTVFPPKVDPWDASKW
jgi:hypothetical protein